MMAIRNYVINITSDTVTVSSHFKSILHQNPWRKSTFTRKEFLLETQNVDCSYKCIYFYISLWDKYYPIILTSVSILITQVFHNIEKHERMTPRSDKM